MGPLSGAGVDDLENLVALSRSAAALQPDGTRLPARRCQASRRLCANAVPVPFCCQRNHCQLKCSQT